MADTDTDTPTVIPDATVIDDVPTPQPTVAPEVRKGSALPAIAGGAFAGIIGFAVAQFVPDGWPLQSTVMLEAKLAEQTTALSAADAEIARLAAAVATLESRPQSDPSVAERLATLESTPADGYDDKAIVARLSGLESELALIAELPSDGTAASPAALAAQAAAIAALQTEVAALKGSGGDPASITAAAVAAEARLAEAEARAAELRAVAEAEAAASFARASLRQIAVALEIGGPFASSLAAFDPGDVPPTLTENAATGLPTLTDLQGSFPDAARAALDASLRADMGDGWTDRVAGFLRSQTGARSLTPREGDDPDAILSRAEAALGAGAVADALALVETLPEAGKVALDAWVSTATLHLAGQDALAALTAAAAGVQE